MKDRKNVVGEKGRVGWDGEKRARRTTDDAEYVPHTRISSEHATEGRPTRDGRYRQDLHASLLS